MLELIDESEFENPFSKSISLWQRLKISAEECHLMLFDAFCHATDVPPQTKSWVNEVRTIATRYAGAEAFIIDPVIYPSIFPEVTINMLRTVRALCNSHLRRNSWMVHQILERMALAVNGTPLPVLVVWALSHHCTSTEPPHNTIEHYSATWSIAELALPLHLISPTGQNYTPHLTVCAQKRDGQEELIALLLSRRAFHEMDLRRVFYDAVIAQRAPAQDALVWMLPTQVIVDNENLRDRLFPVCQSLGIEVDLGITDLEAFRVLSSSWASNLTPHDLLEERFTNILDSFMKFKFGFSPWQVREHKDQMFSYSARYTREPVEQLSELVALLPTYEEKPIHGGAIEINGLHYAAPLLKLFEGENVSVRIAFDRDCIGWAYWHNEFLCRVLARELKRPNDTYRPWRAERDIRWSS